MTDKTFDPNVIFEAIPSFYREQLSDLDKAVLGAFWTGMVRLVDAEYSRLFQVADSIKVREAAATTFFPWVYQEFGSWESRGARHQHRIVRFPGSATGKFYLGRYADPRFIKVYYDGVRQVIEPPSIITNEPDAAQLQYLIYGATSFTKVPGTRVELRTFSGGVSTPSTAFGNASKEVVIEIERELHRGFIFTDGLLSTIDPIWADETDTVVPDQQIDPDLAKVTLSSRYLSTAPGFSVDNVESEYPTLTWSTGFQAGQVLRILRVDGSVTDETINSTGTTYKLRTSRTDSGGWAIAAVFLSQNVQLYPDPVVVEATKLTFARALPVGLRVRVTDPAGTQSFTVKTPARTFMLDNEVDPDNASVFVYNIDLTAIEVTADGYDFKRPIESNCVLDFEAPLVFPHDHARFTYVQIVPGTLINLPATRPLALNADLTESARYPVKVFINGQLLKRSTYTFNSTIEIQTTATIDKGDVVEVIYTDAEEVEDHIHFYDTTEVPNGVVQSVILMPETIEADRYPVTVESTQTLIPAADTRIALDQYVQLRPEVTGDETLFTEGISRGLNYRIRLPSRVDESEGYLGTIVSAQALQDGIDSPANTAEGESLHIERDGEETVVESSYAFETGWFKNVYVDEHQVNDIFGIPIGYLDHGESTERYRDVTMALYTAYRRGSQLDTLENFGCIVLGSAFARKGGVDKGVVFLDDQARVRRVEDATGARNDVALHPVIPDRIPATSKVPTFFAGSAYCVVTDHDLDELPWLAFFAESLSDDYAYAKRLDARTPREYSGTVTSYDKNRFILEDHEADFYDLEVWPNDLIRLTTTGDDALALSAVTVYSRVTEVIDEHHLKVEIDLDSAAYGWGEPDGWGETTGWGGFAGADDLSNYTIWTRKTRRLDTYRFLDEALDESQALADGEAVQRINEKLAAVLDGSIFTIKIDWYANTDRVALDEFKTFIETAKAAEVGYFAYTEVNNDEGITDTLECAVIDRGPLLLRDDRFTFIGEDFIGSMYMAPDIESAGIGSVTFDESWWDPES